MEWLNSPRHDRSGTRPEAIKLAPVIRTFKACDALQTRVVLTGQHREMVAQVWISSIPRLIRISI